ncbi:hypothetical protein A9Q84_07110 [Halobacteriovorax marinus]|mgnify:CR=1 FL=1|uniref:Uncharacterized protein n=1 Tax=Halobacteriovorax marinus TaxID=97084 RepID=A0A1Y5F5X5_9BACT|nr:hypothetical protein A9Q84_07110 [Halobacteriovorax marinus]
MQFFRFSFLFFLLVSQTFATSMFSDMECLRGNFDSKVEHKSAPFGLSKKILTLNKEDCIITVSHEKMKFLKNNWVIDVCRGPVHIKKTDGAVEVLKRADGCSAGSSKYCKELKNLETILQDDGLIFADGEKENISTEHGKIYCSYLLVKKYLRDGFIFNRGKEYSGVLVASKIKKVAPVISTPNNPVNPVNGEEQVPANDGPADF